MKAIEAKQMALVKIKQHKTFKSIMSDVKEHIMERQIEYQLYPDTEKLEFVNKYKASFKDLGYEVIQFAGYTSAALRW